MGSVPSVYRGYYEVTCLYLSSKRRGPHRSHLLSHTVGRLDSKRKRLVRLVRLNENLIIHDKEEQIDEITKHNS